MLYHTVSSIFQVEEILKPHEVFIGLDYARKRDIQKMLSDLDRRSLQLIPVSKLKIDQVVLLEHMNELVRGRANEITRQKINLKLLDSREAPLLTSRFIDFAS